MEERNRGQGWRRGIGGKDRRRGIGGKDGGED
jgi:hypothetical protein